MHITNFTLSSFFLSKRCLLLQKLLKASPKPKLFTVLDTTYEWICTHISQVWGFCRWWRCKQYVSDFHLWNKKVLKIPTMNIHLEVCCHLLLWFFVLHFPALTGLCFWLFVPVSTLVLPPCSCSCWLCGWVLSLLRRCLLLSSCLLSLSGWFCLLCPLPSI